MEAAGEAEGGMVAPGAEVVGMVATTADGAIGTLDTTDGTAAGDGGVAVLTRGGFSCRQSFQFQFRTQLTEDMATGRDTVTVQATGTEEDTDWGKPQQGAAATSTSSPVQRGGMQSLLASRRNTISKALPR
jgi:hypothetical protein